MEQNIFEIFTYQGFKFPNVNALYEDNNNLWLATNNGLYQINYNEETIENFSESYDFPSSLLFSLLPDQLGNLWITTNNGLVRFNMENKKLDVFTQHDGLQSNGFNRGAYIQTDAGAIYIGGVNGFNKFDPQDVQDHSTSKTLLSGEVISRDGNTRQMKVDETGIQLKYQHDRVEFKFTPIHFKNPAGNRFSYRLFNYDTVWHDGVARNDPRIVAYEDLPPGDYIFTLRTSANIGVWSAPSSIKFSIAVPFWQTWWAVLIYTILAAAVVAGLIAWRNRHLTQKAANLKKIIENKTQEIINKNNELEELLDFRSRFYRRAAHEIRTPLTLVQLPLQEYVTEKINVSGGEYEHQKIGALVMVLRNIQRLKRITDQMLSYSKNTYVSNDDLQIIDLRSTLLPLLTMTEKNAAENGIRFFYDDIPKAAVTLDRDALEDIVVNLLSNAIKYTNSGGTVMFNLQLSKDALNIEVHDTGIGISKSELETVFQPFFRGEDIHDDNGFGVGLSVVKEKIERSKSKITMHSIKDEGTEFIVTMPILLPSIDELSELPDNLSAIEYWPTNTPAEERPSLLVIEDDSDMCTLLRSILSTEFNVNLVNNCKDAKSSITEKTYDAVLTDALLPDGSGFDLVMHFRAQDETAHLPIIMLTALSETEPMERALELGVDDYVVKPFSSTELLLRVKSHISNRTRVGHWWRQQSKSDYSSIEESTEKLSTQRVLSPKDSTFLDILRSYIEEHVGDSDLTLPIAAKEVAVSERQIQRKLKTLLDTTFTEYLTEIRMRKAASLLETGITVKEVSALVGYNDASHFASLFKERFGVTPSKFKSGELESYQ
jgi:signal transduction histidine kinase/DNA-binding response OmpR family regulator